MYYLVKIAEKMSGKKCAVCAHCVGGHCVHPDSGMFGRCYNSMRRPGFSYAKSWQTTACGDHGPLEG